MEAVSAASAVSVTSAAYLFYLSIQPIPLKEKMEAFELLLYLLAAPTLFYGFRPLIKAIYAVYSFFHLPLNKHSPISQKIKDERGKILFPQPYPHPYPNGWYNVVNSHDLVKGQVKGIEYFGEKLVVFRQEDGKAAVLNAICPHLGANMAVGGKVIGGCIQCPFHNWQFDGQSGKCTKIPYCCKEMTTQGKVEESTHKCKMPTGASAKVWHSEEVNYAVYVWFHSEGAPPSWRIPIMVPTDSEGKELPLVYHGKHTFDTACHIQEITENGVDYAHFDTLHAKFSMYDLISFGQGWNPISWQPRDIKSKLKAKAANVNSIKDAKVSPNSVTTSTGGKITDLEDLVDESKVEVVDEKHIVDIEVESWLIAFNRFQFGKARAKAQMVGMGNVFINLILPFGGQLTVIQSIVAVAPNLQLITLSLYASPRVPKFVSKLFMAFTDTSLSKDIKIWNEKTLLVKPLLVKNDGPIGQFRRWAKQFYSKNVFIEAEKDE